MILSGQSIRRLCTYSGNRAEGYITKFTPMVTPFQERDVHPSGMSYGLSIAGYDIRVEKFKKHEEDGIVDHVRMQNGDFLLASSVERIKMPNDVIAFVKDKSSWARKGLAVQNTVLEPGWEGYITLELSFHRPAYHVVIEAGMPIAQVIFQRLDEPAEKPYTGKYQNQKAEPMEAISEKVLTVSEWFAKDDMND